MKKVLFIALGIIATGAVAAIALTGSTKTETTETAKTEKVDLNHEPSSKAQFDFGNATWDFGTITEGEVVVHAFEFTNTGKEPLIISKAKGSCGCTVPSWPKEPIAPGETAEIMVSFNSRGKANMQNKTVTVTANTNPAQTRLRIKGNVLKKES